MCLKRILNNRNLISIQNTLQKITFRNMSTFYNSVVIHNIHTKIPIYTQSPNNLKEI